MARVRRNFITGTLGASLAQAGTSITFAAAPQLPNITSPDYPALIINPTPYGAVASGSEIVYLTSYAGGTGGTIVRSQEGTAAPTTWVSGTPYALGALTSDFTLTSGMNNGDFPTPTASGQLFVSTASGASNPSWTKTISGVTITGSNINGGTVSNIALNGTMTCGTISGVTITGSNIYGGGIISTTITGSTVNYGTITNSSFIGGSVGPTTIISGSTFNAGSVPTSALTGNLNATTVTGVLSPTTTISSSQVVYSGGGVSPLRVWSVGTSSSVVISGFTNYVALVNGYGQATVANFISSTLNRSTVTGMTSPTVIATAIGQSDIGGDNAFISVSDASIVTLAPSTVFYAKVTDSGYTSGAGAAIIFGIN